MIAILGAGSIYFLRWAHFVGADESSGHVAVYQGLPIDLFGGVKLYHEVSDTHIAYASLDQATRKKLFDHTIRSDASARSVAEQRRQLWPMRSARFRELWNLLAVAVLTGVGFLSVYTARQQEITSTSLIYAAFFLALYFVAHLGLRAGLPDADPWLLPLSALLTAMGLTEIYRLNPLLARDQSIWIVVGLGGFLALILLVGDHRKLESYKYTLGVAGGGAAGDHDAGGHDHQRRQAVAAGGRHPGAAGRVRKAAAGDLPGRLPAREAGAADDGAPPDPGSRACRRPATWGRCWR